MRDVAVELNWSEGTEIGWRPEYAEIFGSRERLLLALRSRLQITLHSQIDDLAGPGGQPADVLRALAAMAPGVVRALALPDAIRWIDVETEVRPWAVSAA